MPHTPAINHRIALSAERTDAALGVIVAKVGAAVPARPTRTRNSDVNEMETAEWLSATLEAVAAALDDETEGATDGIVVDAPYDDADAVRLLIHHGLTEPDAYAAAESTIIFALVAPLASTDHLDAAAAVMAGAIRQFGVPLEAYQPDHPPIPPAIDPAHPDGNGDEADENPYADRADAVEDGPGRDPVGPSSEDRDSASAPEDDSTTDSNDPPDDQLTPAQRGARTRKRNADARLNGTSD